MKEGKATVKTAAALIAFGRLQREIVDLLIYSCKPDNVIARFEDQDLRLIAENIRQINERIKQSEDGIRAILSKVEEIPDEDISGVCKELNRFLNDKQK